MSQTGYFVISLDFELLYGLSDLPDQKKQRERVLRGRTAIEGMLQLFSQYGIHTTWAMVGMLMANNKEELQHFLPLTKPEYDRFNHDLSLLGDNEAEDPYHYGGELLQKIRNTPYQEVGSHTFSHYYCMVEGQDESDFEKDLHAAIQMARERKLALHSIVFPRNQVNPNYIPILNKYGIKVYRGNERAWIYSATGQKESAIKRALRLADSYINVSGMNCYDLRSMECKDGVINIPSSRFLRPYMERLKWLEKAKIKRIVCQMKYAAKHHKVFHLWWHPHNFGENLEDNLKNLKMLLACYEELNTKYGFQSVTMGELGAIVYENCGFRRAR